MKTPLLVLERERLLELDLALTREWLETDGLGGYASSTVLLCPTRRYHGLLVSTFPGTDKRHVFLSRFEESVHSLSSEPLGPGGEGHFPLSIARYPGSFHPHGHKTLVRFELSPFPTWEHSIGDARIRRSIQMLKGSPTVLVRYELVGGAEPVELRLRPLVAFREADALTFENVDLHPEVTYLDEARRTLRLQPYAGLPALTLALAAKDGAFEGDPLWYRTLEYKVDRERGYDDREDNFTPGLFRARLEPGESVVVAATLATLPRSLVGAWDKATKEREKRAKSAGNGPKAQLDLGADDFLYRTREGRLGVVAGYPWFTEWGRDTFLSLPGLLLARGRTAECGEALEGALKFLDAGLLPNIFGSTPAKSHYGSVDASLWFARAVRLFDLAGGDKELLMRRLRPALEVIAQQYSNGTRLGIGTEPNGLLFAGDGRLNTTWMDAVVDGVAVTPREGLAVELNALWYFLIAYLEDLAKRANDTRGARRWRHERERVGAAFLEHFWLPEARYLADRWKDGAPDLRVRPNMLIAAALEHSPLSDAQRADVVQKSELELLTPMGLRTLGPRDPDYQGRFGGGPAERDRAYHQGTVWPWLLGFHCEAYLRAHGFTRKNGEHVLALLAEVEGEVTRHGLNHVSEVYDGDPPHRPGGTIAQAWSTAEILRARALAASTGARRG
ncbi:MAG: glycogen debranching enzyme N-terminal domain-containing protein [Planctomycetaceae bacterium]|nr:glycogen debranching enzyme N-terminal domain-containing protein [Planctomycetaceae bacterium]